eukprot:CAMPEP_0119326748 /NCGR_PEP_ID=MMETSP1333-20130426/69165_1 /TAXON_ID=418940 /ORGANISM="Scyphosphaera apsteinii, Strain RCC1455" /LENGTH=197 /DNA_ID=CAMNT_0007335139 /DNA_START=52 /DNA_END=645 /DNA_ORIENTATION=+
MRGAERTRLPVLPTPSSESSAYSTSATQRLYGYGLRSQEPVALEPGPSIEKALANDAGLQAAIEETGEEQSTPVQADEESEIGSEEDSEEDDTNSGIADTSPVHRGDGSPVDRRDEIGISTESDCSPVYPPSDLAVSPGANSQNPGFNPWDELIQAVMKCGKPMVDHHRDSQKKLLLNREQMQRRKEDHNDPNCVAE